MGGMATAFAAMACQLETGGRVVASRAINAWVILKSLETLPLRVAAQSETAGKIAGLLFQHTKIKK